MIVTSHRSLRRLLGCLLVLAPLLMAPAARADSGGTSRSACRSNALENPFSRWGDDADYFLIRSGDVGDGHDWILDGATIAAANNPYSAYPNPAASLSVAADQDATSAPVCVTIDDPTLRFFVRNTGASTGLLHVDLLYRDGYGEEHSLEIGVLTGLTPDTWGPSPIIPLPAPLLDLLGDGSTPVQFRFRAEGAGSSWLVDDVYVDPYGKG